MEFVRLDHHPNWGKKQVMFQTTKQFSMLDHPSEKDDGSQDGHL